MAGGSTRVDRIADPWGPATPCGPGEEWPPRVDRFLLPGAEPERWVQTASILHSDGDAYDIGVQGGRIVGVRGRASDRVNRGRLGPKDLFGWQANHSADRLTTPLLRRDGELREAPWDEAMDAIVARSRELLDERGPGAFGFYTSGQLFLEEYYTLATVARAGIGTNHLDGNTRLCTATAGEALKESFGSDGQPGSYDDVHHADTLVLFGHNVAETQPVLWRRMLDRLEGPDPPRLVVVDPRLTVPARRADVHVALKPGTNLAFMNALLHELFANGWVDEEYVAAHAIGLEKLREQVEPCTPEWAAEVCGVDAHTIRKAASLAAAAERLFCTVLQGFYQSHQATAASCQVNNLVLLRGMLGRPGCGVLQMNGQPTAQNTRETGANGDLPGFRNWANDDHVSELARIWNVDPLQIPHWGPPTHVMEMVRYLEQGTLPFFWVSATNPLVSLPEAGRIRDVLASDRVFCVVQDLFLTETAAVADVVLPAATWAEKTGTFTNADRTVHLSEKAIDPPGEARPDLDIFLDYARRMDLRDKDGAPLVKWATPEEAFEAFKECVRGRPCDYDGITYEALRGGSGLQWGGERLYADGRFCAAPGDCETYGRDLLTGASIEEDEGPRRRGRLAGGERADDHELGPRLEAAALQGGGRAPREGRRRRRGAGAGADEHGIRAGRASRGGDERRDRRGGGVGGRMKLDVAIDAVHESESRIAATLGELRERHQADHEVFHMARTLTRLAEANVEALAPFAERYGADAGDARPAKLAKERDEGLLLLGDLRELHLAYCAASIDWVVLAQAAQAARDAELLSVISACHEQTLRGLKWTVTQLKVKAPQTLTS